MGIYTLFQWSYFSTYNWYNLGHNCAERAMLVYNSNFFGLMVDISIQDEGLQNDFPWTGEAPPLQSLATTICEPWCWNIYQHLPEQNSPSYVGKYTSTTEHMGLENTTIPEWPSVLFHHVGNPIRLCPDSYLDFHQRVPRFKRGLLENHPLKRWCSHLKKNMHF